MRKNAVLLTLALLEALALLLLGLFWFVMRPDLLGGYGLDPSHAVGRAEELLPLSTRVAFSPWFVVQSGAVGLGLMVLAAMPFLQTRRRMLLAGAGLVWTVFGLSFAIGAAYLPAFRGLE